MRYIALALLLLGSLPLHAQPAPVGLPFLVHESPTGNQKEPAVAVAADGRFVVAWAEFGQQRRTLVRLFDAEGRAIGGEIELARIFQVVGEAERMAVLTVQRKDGSAGEVRVDVDTASGTAIAGEDFLPVRTTLFFADQDSQPQQVIVSLPEDFTREPAETFSVVLSNPGGGAVLGDNDRTVVEIRDANGPPVLGVPSGPLMLAETSGSPVITATPAGELFIGWVQGVSSGSIFFIRRFAASGEPVDDLFSAYMTSGNSAIGEQRFAADNFGNVDVTWFVFFDRHLPILFRTRFDVTTSQFEELPFDFWNDPIELAHDAAGNLWVLGQSSSNSELEVVRYSPAGERLANRLLGVPECLRNSIDFAADQRDRWLVACTDTFDGDGRGILGVLMSPDFDTPPRVSRLNTDHAGDQGNPSVAGSAAGAFLVAWESPDGDGKGIYARRFSHDGVPLGDAFQVNTRGRGEQTRPQVAADGGGRVLVVWESRPVPEASPELRAQLVGAEGELLGSELLIAAGGENAAVTADLAGNFAVAWQETIAGRSIVYAVRLVPLGGPGNCVANETTLCLMDGRFQVRAVWRHGDGTRSGVARARPLQGDSGSFWFFSPDNLELAVKVLDGRSLNEHFWVFLGSLTEVGVTLTVTDTATGRTRVYEQAPGEQASFGDTTAFSDE